MKTYYDKKADEHKKAVDNAAKAKKLENSKKDAKKPATSVVELDSESSMRERLTEELRAKIFAQVSSEASAKIEVAKEAQ